MLAERVASSISRGFQIPRPPTLVSHHAGRSGIAFTHFKNEAPQKGFSVPSRREAAFVFNVPLISARFSTVAVDGLRQSVVQSPGEAYLFDLTRRTEVSLDTLYESVRIHIPQDALDEIALERGVRRVGGLRAPTLGQKDEVLHRLALAILPAILNLQQVTTAYVDYLALALHEHVTYTYGGVPAARVPAGGLAPWQLRRACALVEDHLLEDHSIAVLAAECGVSASYFARAFRASVGMTPHQWIIRRRVERAKALIAHSNEPLADIAASCGFVDQSHLGRCFTRFEGMPPGRWRRERVRHA